MTAHARQQSANSDPAEVQVPPHSQTQSTLAPTSEFVRYLLLALPTRYTFRSLIEGVFNAEAPRRIYGAISSGLEKIWGPHGATDSNRNYLKNISYDYALGLGSLILTRTYTGLVKKDIHNMFCETVGMELGKPADQVSFEDLKHSDNRIVKKTLFNYQRLTWERYGTDILFFLRPLLGMRWLPLGDMMVGVKGALALKDTWKRRTTMFEDLITFVNNKINPRNGLGQPISVGEVFDLYQHYYQIENPQGAFAKIVAVAGTESDRWAASQPIFQRIAELMNRTYAYKHPVEHDHAGDNLPRDNFPLPKFIYLLGHDLIDVSKPEKTRALIEIANAHGIAAVKDAQRLLAQHQDLAAIVARYPVTIPQPHAHPQEQGRNGVIARGSTLQLDAAPGDAPSSLIESDSAHATPLLESAATQAIA